MHIMACCGAGRPSANWYREKIAETLDDDFTTGPRVNLESHPMTNQSHTELAAQIRKELAFVNRTAFFESDQIIVTLLKQCVAALESPEPTISTEHGPWLPSQYIEGELRDVLKHIAGAAMDITCERRTIRDAALAALRASSPADHVVDANKLVLSCEWTEESPEEMPGTYRTACGELFAFTEGGLKENVAKFCQYCGGAIVTKESST